MSCCHAVAGSDGRAGGTGGAAVEYAFGGTNNAVQRRGRSSSNSVNACCGAGTIADDAKAATCGPRHLAHDDCAGTCRTDHCCAAASNRRRQAIGESGRAGLTCGEIEASIFLSGFAGLTDTARRYGQAGHQEFDAVDAVRQTFLIV